MKLLSISIYFLLAIVSILNFYIGKVDVAIWCLLLSFWFYPFLKLSHYDKTKHS